MCNLSIQAFVAGNLIRSGGRNFKNIIKIKQKPLKIQKLSFSESPNMGKAHSKIKKTTSEFSNGLKSSFIFS